MSPRLIIILAVVGIIASGVGIARWIVQPPAAHLSGADEASPEVHPTPTAALIGKSSLVVMPTATFAAARR